MSQQEINASANKNIKRPKLRSETVTSSSKKKYEWLWKAFFVLISIVSAMLVQKIYIFQTHDYFESARKGSLNDLLIYSLPFAVLFTLMDLLIHKYFDPIFEEHYITDQKYTEPQARKKRVYTLVKWAYSIIYYIISSVWAYKIMRETPFLPTWLGGNGDISALVQDSYHFNYATTEMKVFYLLQAGKHFSRFFSHVFIRPEGNFFEYALHHGLSVFLIMFSYLTNQWTIGIFVLMLHDYSDFALIWPRMYRDYKYFSKKILDFVYVHATFFWLTLRIFIFTYCCVYGTFVYIYEVVNNRFNQFQKEVMTFPLWFMCFMLASLEVLNLFWTYYIVESFVAVKVEKGSHSYD